MQVSSRGLPLLPNAHRSSWLVSISFFGATPLPYLLLEKLRGSEYGGTQEIKAMTRVFHKSVMTRVRANQKSYFIKFGRSSDNDPSLDIKAGSIKLDRYDYRRSLVLGF
jgi:hypothetical protein